MTKCSGEDLKYFLVEANVAGYPRGGAFHKKDNPNLSDINFLWLIVSPLHLVALIISSSSVLAITISY